MKKVVIFGFCVALLAACTPASESGAGEVVGNPPAEGFNLEASDAEAIAVADEVMEAMGGRAAWDATRYIRWTFFGRRTLLWDKRSGQVRIDVPGDSSVYLVNINDNTGKVLLKGQDISQTDSIAKYLERGKSIWINDAYWLVMPFKLKDSGVTLKYAGKDTTSAGLEADVLELTFAEVGNTPNNKYKVYVDKTDRLVKQWDYFPNAQDDTARMSTPWENYQAHQQIKLSGDRGRGKLTDIAVFTEVPATAFTDFKEPAL